MLLVEVLRSFRSPRRRTPKSQLPGRCRSLAVCRSRPGAIVRMRGVLAAGRTWVV